MATSISCVDLGRGTELRAKVHVMEVYDSRYEQDPFEESREGEFETDADGYKLIMNLMRDNKKAIVYASAITWTVRRTFRAGFTL